MLLVSQAEDKGMSRASTFVFRFTPPESLYCVLYYVVLFAYVENPNAKYRPFKCDEAHPECRNCIIYGRPCPGYRPDAVFRNETRKVERLMKSSANVNTRGNTSTQASFSTSDSSISAVSHRRRASSHGRHHDKATLTLYSPADSSWEQRALCYFFDQYTIKADAEEGGHLDYLPPLYARELGRQSESPSSCLRWAVEATALMTLANAKNAPPLMNKARQGYGRALRGLQEALVSPANAVKDETFASVVLLSLYEDISGERNGLFSSHTAGFEFLTKLRGNTLIGHQRGRDMLTFAYAHTVGLSYGSEIVDRTCIMEYKSKTDRCIVC
jgi:hypothetical protein